MLSVKRCLASLMLMGLLPFLLLPVWAQDFDRAYQEGLLFLREGRFETARQRFELSVQRQPRGENLFALGVVYFRLQQTRLAYESYMRALRRVPSEPLEARIRSGLGDVYFEMEDYFQAAAAYRKALNTEPTWTGARLKLATAYLRQGEYAAALAESERLQSQGIPLAESYYVRSLAFLAQQDWPAAQKALTHLSSYPQHRDEALTHLNWLYRSQKEFALALEAAEILQNEQRDGEASRLVSRTLLEKAQTCPQAHCLKADELIQLRRALERWILSSPENPRAYQGLGELEQFSGHWPEALQAYRRAATLFPEYPLFQLKALGMQAALGQNIQAELQALTLPRPEQIQAELWWELSKWDSLLISYVNQAKTRSRSGSFWRGWTRWQAAGGRSTAEVNQDWKAVLKAPETSLEKQAVQAFQLYEKGAEQWAADLFAQLIAQAPDWWLPHYYLARIQRDQARYDKAYWQHPNHLPLATAFIQGGATQEAHLLRLKRVLLSFPAHRPFQEAYLKQFTDNGPQK